MSEYCHESNEDDLFQEGQSALLYDNHPNADGHNGKYWKADAVPMYIGRCGNCNQNLMDGCEFAGWKEIEGVQHHIDESWNCPNCNWPLNENAENLVRENLEADGVADVDGLSLPALMQIHEQVLSGANG